MKLSLSTSSFVTFFVTAYLWGAMLLYGVLGIKLIDEVLIGILVFYTLYLKSKEKTNRVSREIFFFCSTVFFYLIYSYLLGITNSKAILYDCIQEIKPYLAFYCGYKLSPKFSNGQRVFIINNGIIVMLVILLALPYSLSKYHYFMGRHITLLASMAMTLFVLTSYFRSRQKWLRWAMLTLGLFSTRSKFYVEYIFSLFIWKNNKRFDFSSVKSLVSILSVTVVAIAVIWKKFSYYVLFGFKNGALVARPLMYITSVKILLDYFPFGSGFGSFGNHASRLWYSPLYEKYGLDNVFGLSKEYPAFAADTFYPTLSQFGIAGIALVACFWIKRYRELKSLGNRMLYKTGMTIIMFMAIECFADTTLISNRGALLMLLLGLICAKSKSAKTVSHPGNDVLNLS